MSDNLRIYVAGSSDERDRARRWMDKLKLWPGVIIVTSTWCDTIEGEQHGVGNPRDASDKDRRRWAEKNLEEIEESDVLWFLVPERSHGRGGYYESATADCLGVKTIYSGDIKQSVFCVLGKEFPTDEEAYAYILAEMGLAHLEVTW